ncbi:bifunctional phosphoribosyl-AMP cyclohydrolase/phosphoribosyl-ATP diphosphatase HisIE [Kallotenue papyrolyticum]|uniref:bifunctional phosphoribosyl-AMP cyclohydrolase/phosphoribosyl-ATP diphosphatase HisIE n=1 Tax=Kallotenue papyrolyticum TaxID=1325125 RepID=UPI0004924841|nr:bifunctional phosphoribosyl-AMP cyclohydrolase/phosphoribosyl-ATP diphosphatase HisIE [Kallotenue papyrolyticum]
MLKFDANGLIPAIVQHARSGEVLMLGYMNREALEQTRASGLVTFWSRSRQALWQKGATSGHVLRLVELRADCDGDALLVLAEPDGPTCHTGARTCFFRRLDQLDGASSASSAAAAPPTPPSAVLALLADLIAQRRRDQPEGSYTVKLLHGGPERIGKKVGEEATEVVIGAIKGDPAELAYESADLIYHLLVLLASLEVTPEQVWNELQRRYATP